MRRNLVRAVLDDAKRILVEKVKEIVFFGVIALILGAVLTWTWEPVDTAAHVIDNVIPVFPRPKDAKERAPVPDAPMIEASGILDADREAYDRKMEPHRDSGRRKDDE